MSLSLKELSYSYPNKDILNSVSLDIADSEILAIMGASGSGKSTLLKLVTSFLLYDSGEIVINKIKVNSKKPYSNFGYICQNASEMTYPWLRLEANLLKPLKRRKLLTSDSKTYASKLLEKFRLTDRKEAFLYNLSGGELKRLSVAMALVYKPDVLLLDEPFSGLDLKLTHELWGFMLSYLEEVKPTGILITHSLEEASLLANRVGIFRQDKTITVCEKGRDSFVKNVSMEKFYQQEFIDYRIYLKDKLMEALNEKTI